MVQAIFGDAVLAGGMVGALVWQAPVLVPLAAGSWFAFALTLPVQADRRDAATRRRMERAG